MVQREHSVNLRASATIPETNRHMINNEGQAKNGLLGLDSIRRVKAELTRGP